jgi:hypothetical protein
LPIARKGNGALRVRVRALLDARDLVGEDELLEV